jgi:hypothetical protein
VARVVRRVTRQLIGRHGADSAVSGDDNRDVRGRNVVCGEGSNSRQKSATGVSIREGVPVARANASVTQVFSQARVSNPNQIARSPVGCATMFSTEAGASE